MSDLGLVVALFSPLALGGLVHGLCKRFGWFSKLLWPLDRGLLVRGRRLFGENKTLRGVVAVALGTSLGFIAEVIIPGVAPAAISSLSLGAAALFGLAFGAAAMLSELPNSFLKRQLGVGPGESGSGWLGAVFYTLDQVDLLLGCWLVALFVVRPTLKLIVLSLVFVYLAHQVINVIGYALGMRKSAR